MITFILIPRRVDEIHHARFEDVENLKKEVAVKACDPGDWLDEVTNIEVGHEVTSYETQQFVFDDEQVSCMVIKTN